MILRPHAHATEPLIGRAKEVALFEELLGDARAGGARAVTIVGETGVGKTRLLAALGERAAAAGFEVLGGSGSEFERDVPFALAVDALDEPLGDLGPTLVEWLGEERMAELGAILPSVRDGARARASTLQAERFRTHHAMRMALEHLARDRPLAILLDDVHWADPASIEFISHLVRRRVPRSLLALAYRHARAPRPLVRALEWAGREGALRSVEVGPLSLEEARELLAGDLEASRIEALHRESGGTPFYLKQLARADPGVAVPERVREAMGHELGHLTSDAQRLARAGAVLGERFDVDLATEIAGLDEPSMARAVDELTSADIARSTDAPRELEFRHPIIRSATYESETVGRRLRSHERAARALARRHAPVAWQAHHVERSAARGDDQAIAVLAEAGRASASVAPAAAAGWFEAALRLLPSDAAPERRFQLLASLAGSLGATGRLQATRDVLAEALELAPSESRGQVVLMLSRARQALGHGDEVHTLLVQELAAAEPGSAVATTLQLELAENHLTLGDWDEAARLGDEARRHALALGDRALQLSATVFLTFADTHRGALAEARRRLDEVETAVDALPDEDLVAHLDALAMLAWVEISLERLVASVEHAERGLRLARATGQGYLFLRFIHGLAAAMMMQGRLEEARSASEAAVESSLLLDSDQMVALTLGVNCWIALVQGETELALARGREAAVVAERAPHTLWAGLAQACYGEALVEAGRHEEGRARILAAGGVELSALQENARPHWYRVLTEAEIAAGRIDEGDLIAARAERLAASLGLEMHRGAARYARACVLLARGDVASAATAACEAAERYEAAGWRIEAARARLLAGRALAAAGRTQRAAAELEAAGAVFDECGAMRLGDRAAQELRRIGRRPGRRFARDDGALTKREREIADLAARGYTNKEIGEALFISAKTVETHLTRIFAKLDVSSRVSLAAIVGGEDTEPRISDEATVDRR